MYLCDFPPPYGVVLGRGLAGTRRRPAAEDSVPPSLQILPHTHILTARSPAPYSAATPRRAHSPTAFSGPIARPPPSPAHAPCSHPQTGPPDSATSPVIVLYSRALRARLCVLELPPSPARAPCSHPQTGPPDSATSPVIVLYSRTLFLICVC
jgi:hypothetical protein